MERFGVFFIDLLAQFGGGRGGLEHELVRTGLEGTLWGALLGIALWRRRVTDQPRERILAWAFAFGLARATLLFLVFALDLLGLFPFSKSHLVFPPLEHAFLLASVVLVAAAFIRFLRDDEKLAERYLLTGGSVVLIGYALTATTWARHLLQNPTSRFGLVWGDQLFHVSGVVLLGWGIYLLSRKKGTVSTLVVAAMTLFLLDDAIMVVNLAFGDNWGPVLAPIRHNLHNLAIPLLGVVYLHELIGDWKATERARGERERRYLRLLAGADRGVGMIELVRDQKGIPLNYRLLEVNLAGAMQAGLDQREMVGKFGSEIFKGPRPPLLRMIAQADSRGLDRVIRVRSPRTGVTMRIELLPLHPGRLAVIVNTVTSLPLPGINPK